MRVQVDVAAAVCLALVMSVSMSGCQKKQGTSSPGSHDAAAEAKSPGDSADPVAELAALEGRMRGLGLPIATDKRETEKTEGETAGSPALGGGGGETEGQLAEEAPAPTPAPTAHVDATSPGRDESIDYCGDLCSLSESICTLEARICSLAEAHTNDMTYADACERAVEDCEVAGDACDSCG